MHCVEHNVSTKAVLLKTAKIVGNYGELPSAKLYTVILMGDLPHRSTFVYKSFICNVKRHKFETLIHIVTLHIPHKFHQNRTKFVNFAICLFGP